MVFVKHLDIVRISSQSLDLLGTDEHLAVLGMRLEPAAPRTLRENRPTRLAALMIASHVLLETRNERLVVKETPPSIETE